MSQLLDRRRSSAGATTSSRTPPRPVLPGPLSLGVARGAEGMSIDSALEPGVKLILPNMLKLPPYPLTVRLAREYATLPHEEDLDAVRATADRAAGLGIPTELLRVSSPRPVTALIELAHERQAGLLVF